jgi:DNA-binding MarR family transcriptional regulator
MSTTPETRLPNLLRHLSTLPLLQLSEDIELSRSAITLLTWVSTCPGCGVVDIAKGLKLSPPTISVAIRRLVKDGWLERRSDPEDRRARPIYLTPKSEDFILRLRMHQTRMFKIFLSGLTLEEQDLLLSLLERALDSMVESVEEGIL